MKSFLLIALVSGAPHVALADLPEEPRSPLTLSLMAGPSAQLLSASRILNGLSAGVSYDLSARYRLKNPWSLRADVRFQRFSMHSETPGTTYDIAADFIFATVGADYNWGSVDRPWYAGAGFGAVNQTNASSSITNASLGKQSYPEAGQTALVCSAWYGTEFSLRGRWVIPLLLRYDYFFSTLNSGIPMSLSLLTGASYKF